MTKCENNPLQDVLNAIDTVTHLDATVVFLDAAAAGKNAAYGAEDKGTVYICVNTGVSFDKMLQGMAMVAAGYAAEKKENVSQKEVFAKITAELLRIEGAENE